MSFRVAVDIGGTFTDLVAIDESSGEIFAEKSSSRADEPIAAVLGVLGKADLRAEEIVTFIHGTTVTTNALLERKGARTAYVTNRGFRDAIFVQNANRRDLYSLDWKKPRPLASRHDCLEIECRVDRDGRELSEPDEGDIDAVIEHLRREEISAVAISFLFSYVNPAHELLVGERLREAIPGLSLSLSHLVYPRWRESDRGHTTLADAFLKPMFRRYTENLGAGLGDGGLASQVVVMKSNGGVVDIETAAEQPVNYLVSGPVGGVLGGAHFASLAGFDRILTVDIGGTSCDVSMLVDGEPRRAGKFELDFGIPVCAPMIDIRTIGAGGGSIAWIDAGGLLRVGPQSAGSSPGPACYGLGGEDPTLTDANLVLGRLNPSRFAGGDFCLREERAESAIGEVAERLGESPEQTALEIIQLANHSMVNALSLISVEQGIDPRGFTIVGFGGAGALHVAGIASILGVTRVLVPPYPGNTSALGLLTAGLRVDLATTVVVRSDEADGLETLNRALLPLRERARESLERDGHVGEAAMEQVLEMRYFGQNHHREIVIPPEAPLGGEAYAAVLESFHEDHLSQYGYAQREDMIEIVGISVTAISERIPIETRFHEPDRDLPPEERRPVFFEGHGWLDTGVRQREGLTAGTAMAGPLLIEERLSTTLVPPGWSVTVHQSGSLVIETEDEL